jgi:flagellar biogenesis protein FliO
MEIWRRRLIQNEGEVGPMQKLPQTLNTFADATILLMIIAFIALAAWLLAHSGF